MFIPTKKAETIPEKEALMLYRLITLTNSGKLKWENKSNIFSSTRYICKITYRYASKVGGFTFETKWLRDGQPQLMISKDDQAIMVITGGVYDYTVEHLITRIRLYCPANNPTEHIEQVDYKDLRTQYLDEIIGKICV